MTKTVKIIVVFSASIIILIIAGSFYNLQRTRKDFSKDILVLQKEKNDIQVKLKEKEQALEKAKQELEQLQYPQRLRDSLLSMQELVRKLNADLKNLEQENAVLQGNNSANQNRIQGYAQRMEALVEELKQNKQKVIELQQALEEEKNKAIRARQKEESAVSKDMEALKAKYLAVEKEKNMLRQRLAAEATTAAAPQPSQRNDEVVAKLKAAVSDRNEEIRRMRQELVQLEYLKKREEDLLALKAKLEGQVSNLSGELEAKQGEIVRMEEAFNQAQSQKQETIDAVNKELEKLKGLYTAIEGERNNLKEKEKELASVNAGLQQQIADLFGALKGKESEISTLQQSLEQTKSLYEKKLDGLTAELNTLTVRYSAIEQERNNLKQKEEQLNTVNAGLQQKLEELDAVIKTKEANIARLEDDLKQTQARAAQQVERITAELKTMEGRYNEYESQMNALKLKQEALTVRNGQLEKRIAELSDILNVKENEIALTKERFEQMRSVDSEKLKKLSDELNQLSSKYDTAQAERDALKQKEAILSELNSKLQQQIGDLFTKLKDKESELAVLQQSFEQAKALSLEKITTITQELQDMQSRYAEFQRQRDELKQSESELRSSNAMLQDQVFELSETLKNKQNEINLLQESFKQAKKIDLQKIEDLTRELDNLQKLYSSIDSEKKKSSLKEQALSTLTSNLQEQITLLSKSLKAKEFEMNRLTEQFQNVRSSDNQQFEATRQALAQLKERYLAIEQERNNLAQKEAELRTFNTTLQKQVSQLSQQLDEKNRQLLQLKQGVTSASVPAEAFVGSNVQSLQEKIRVQEAELQKVTDSYLRLKDQLQKIGGQLSQKEAELANKEREAQLLRQDINYLKANTEQWGNVSVKTAKEQDYLIEELSRALDLNARLQERLNEASTFVGGNVTTATPAQDYSTLDSILQRKSVSAPAAVTASFATPSTVPVATSVTEPSVASAAAREEEEYKKRVEKLRKEVEVILQGVDGTKKKK